jgi:hypothetical protein
VVKVKKQSNVVKKTKPVSVLSRIVPVSSLSNEGMTVALYGYSGTGKTTMLATFPKPLLVIGTEKGTRSIYNVKGVDFVLIKNPEEIADIVEGIRSKKLCYNSVGLDTATVLQDLVLAEILGIEELPVQKSWGLATRSQYGQCAMQMKEHLKSLLRLSDLGVNVVIVTQERNFTSDDDSESSELLAPHVGPSLTQSVTNWLNPAVDYILQTMIRRKMVTTEKKVKVGKKVKITTVTKPGKGVEYCIRTSAHPVYTTKFRVPKGSVLPEVIVDPSYDKIAEIVKGKK